MKFVTFSVLAGDPRLGALIEDSTQIVDLAAAGETVAGTNRAAFASLLALIEAGEDALENACGLLVDPPDDTVLATDAVRLLSPIPRPPQIRDCLCFEEHLLQAYAVLRKVRASAEADPKAALKRFEKEGLFKIPDVWYEQPIYYKANRFSVIGPDEDVIWPDYAELLDYEMEFGCFIGRRGRNIAEGSARDYIFGYSIFND